MSATLLTTEIIEDIRSVKTKILSTKLSRIDIGLSVVIQTDNLVYPTVTVVIPITTDALVDIEGNLLSPIIRDSILHATGCIEFADPDVFDQSFKDLIRSSIYLKGSILIEKFKEKGI